MESWNLGNSFQVAPSYYLNQYWLMVYGVLCHSPKANSTGNPWYQGSWGPSGAYRTQVGPILAPWTLLSGMLMKVITTMHLNITHYKSKSYSLGDNESLGSSPPSAADMHQGQHWFRQYWITNTKQRLHKSSWIVVRNVWKSVIKTVLSQSTYIPMWSLKS